MPGPCVEGPGWSPLILSFGVLVVAGPLELVPPGFFAVSDAPAGATPPVADGEVVLVGIVRLDGDPGDPDDPGARP